MGKNQVAARKRKRRTRAAGEQQLRSPGVVGWPMTGMWPFTYDCSESRCGTKSGASRSVLEDKSSGANRRKRRGAPGTITTTVVALLSLLCAALLWAGAGSLSRWQPRSNGAGSNSTRRTNEARSGGSSTVASSKDGASYRKLSRRPELKTRGGQLAFARFTLLAEYQHDSTAFTQGLCYQDGYLYESTGLLGGKSSIRKVEPETGEVVQITNLQKEHFGEGMVILNDEIHSLTWRSRVGFTWDLQTFEQKKQFSFNTKTGQGWGITTDGESLIVSDGSQFLFFWDPVTMQETRRVEVMDKKQRPLSRINELEMVKGFVFANVWFDDNVYKIDPANGEVVDVYSFAELYPKALRKGEITSKEAVLNGIAWDPVEDVLYITGKLWPRMYKVKLREGEEHIFEANAAAEEEEDDRRRRQLRTY